MAMLLLIVLPLFLYGAALAWENYRNASTRLGEQLALASATGIASVADALNDAERRLRALAALPVVQAATPGACDALLAQVLQVEQPQYGMLAVVDQTGQVRCSARRGSDTARLEPLLAALARHSGDDDFVLGDPVGTPQATLPARLRFAASGFSGVVLATLSLDWLAHWFRDGQNVSGRLLALLDSRNRLVAFGTTPQAVADVTHLLEHRASSDQHRFQIRSTPLPGGLRVVVGSSTLPQAADARHSLVHRLAVLAALLAAGLMAMMVGVGATVVKPVGRLSTAVARWRDGGGFEAGSLRHAPREIAGLSLSFGRAVTALNQREVQLREATTQQELLMQEIHHRVKNNLQIVASLLNLQASRIKLPEARAEFQAARDRIRALATLHRHLYAYGELHTINMRSFLIELCSQLLQALGETAAGGRIRLDIEAPELRMTSDQAVPMALIVTEAVSNAAKYAFPGGRSGHIAVRLLVQGAGTAEETLRLTIEDDGVGMSPAPPETPTETRDGIGTQLIRGFARQLQAAISLTHDGGTRYVLDIPARRKQDRAEAEAMSDA